MKFPRQASLVKQYRLALEFSQAEAGRRLSLLGQHFSNIERGLQGVPPKQARHFARVLKIPSSLLRDAVLGDYADILTKKMGI